MLFRVQLGAAQKFGIVARPQAGPPLPSPPPQGSPPARRGRGGEPGRPAGSAGPARRGEGRASKKPRGAGGAPRSEAELGMRLHSAVSGLEDLPPPPLVHLPPARDAAASFPQCTLAPGGALSSLSLPPPPLPFRRLLRRRARAGKRAGPGVASWRRGLVRAVTVRLRSSTGSGRELQTRACLLDARAGEPRATSVGLAFAGFCISGASLHVTSLVYLSVLV